MKVDGDVCPTNIRVHSNTSSQESKRYNNSQHGNDEEYPCDECDYVAKYSENLKQHKESKHQGVRYPCHKCQYIATQKSSLLRHLESYHMESDQCGVMVKQEPDEHHP